MEEIKKVIFWLHTKPPNSLKKYYYYYYLWIRKPISHWLFQHEKENGYYKESGPTALKCSGLQYDNLSNAFSKNSPYNHWSCLSCKITILLASFLQVVIVYEDERIRKCRFHNSVSERAYRNNSRCLRPNVLTTVHPKF